jgi:hypothetical protein
MPSPFRDKDGTSGMLSRRGSPQVACCARMVCEHGGYKKHWCSLRALRLQIADWESNRHALWPDITRG